MRTEVLKRVRSSANPVVLFDVDSTLISTSARHLAILNAFAQASRNPSLAAFAGTLSAASFGWSVTEPLQGTPFDTPELFDALEKAWFRDFFSDRFLDQDTPVPGAVDFVQQVHRAGAWVYYLTARSAPEMGAGTLSSLLALGFPVIGGRATVHLKPTRAIGDKAFKAAAMQDVARAGTVVATFENEPANAHLFAETFPEALHVLLDTVCSPDAPEPSPDLLRVADFRRSNRPGV